MVVTVPFVVAGLVRYLQLMRVGEGEEPERTLLRDPGLRLFVCSGSRRRSVTRSEAGKARLASPPCRPRRSSETSRSTSSASTAERPGGAVWYCARALSRSTRTADVVLVCRSAPSDRGAMVLGLEQFGFPVRWRSAEHTMRFSFHYEGDRRIMAIDEVADA